MAQSIPQEVRRRRTFAIISHPDAGKTTLTEGLLYTGGALRKLGRVDHRNAFLDNFALERERGITIFSKQAVLPLPGAELTLLDTRTSPPRRSGRFRCWTARCWWSAGRTVCRATP